MKRHKQARTAPIVHGDLDLVDSGTGRLLDTFDVAVTVPARGTTDEALRSTFENAAKQVLRLYGGDYFPKGKLVCNGRIWQQRYPDVLGALSSDEVSSTEGVAA